MLSKFELSELEDISKLPAEEVKQKLLQFIELSHQALKRAEELKNWKIRFVDNKKKRPWIHVQMYNEVYHGVTRHLEMKDCVTLGKIHTDDFEKNRDLFTRYQYELNIDELKKLLIPLYT